MSEVQSFPELMSRSQVVDYLHLAEGGRNGAEALRNLIRRHRLPVIKRAGLQLFRKSAVDAWLEADPRKRMASKPLASQVGPRLQRKPLDRSSLARRASEKFSSASGKGKRTCHSANGPLAGK